MCGITAIVKLNEGKGVAELVKANKIIAHRGPDDEGFLLWQQSTRPSILAGDDTSPDSKQHHSLQHIKEQFYKVGLGHRRLSILDLTPTGHQPMQYEQSGLYITFNGEVYNYLEIKEDLKTLGYIFHTTTDTEVILAAWHKWGEQCLNKFNGMFSFVILDTRNNTVFAVRDRFGVKPMYYAQVNGDMIFASEIKQIKAHSSYKSSLNEKVAKQYLAFAMVDEDTETFDNNIMQLKGGHYIKINLDNVSAYSIHRWYDPVYKPFKGSYTEACERFLEIFTDAVRLRLRSDVEIGSCLSGGLDSSAIVCIASDLLKIEKAYNCMQTVTARYDIARFDEWQFATEVIEKTGSKSHQTFPSFPQLAEEFDSFLWHQDEPTGSSSQFSQWCVFKKTHDAGLKVMVDGQGADEQLAGYGGNDVPLYAGYMRKLDVSNLLSEAKHYKKEKGAWPLSFLLGAFQIAGGQQVLNMFPDKYRLQRQMAPEWLDVNMQTPNSPFELKTLKDSLTRQIFGAPLPSLLRYEDRNSMAFSIESRTPFMDYRLVEFTLSLPPEMVYKNGVRKRILRDATANILPAKIKDRRDKMGFVTPEEVWFKTEGNKWFRDGLDDALSIMGDWLKKDKINRYFDEMTKGNTEFNWTFWRILSMVKYKKSNSI